MDEKNLSFPGLKTGAVIAAHPLAVAAGRQILARGGNAVDAALAVSFALNVTEPQASGIGGGGFLLVHPAQGQPVFLDYRERSSAKCRIHTWHGGAAVAVPGQLRGMDRAHSRFGSLPLADLVAPAIELARKGFPVSSVYTKLLEPRLDLIKRSPAMAEIFLDRGDLPKPGFTLTQPDLAETLEFLGREGVESFYTGSLAEEIVAAVADAGGDLSLEDLANYRVRELEPLAGEFGQYTILTAPPPSAGGTNLLQLLGIWKQSGADKSLLTKPAGIDFLARAMGYVFRDQDLRMGDPAHVQVPLDELLSPRYLGKIAKQIAAGHHLDRTSHQLRGSTTNFVTADRYGNVVVVTQTINLFFGAGIVVPGRGFILNNQVADFTPDPNSPNAPAPNKTPLSNMAPTMVLKDGQLAFALGSPGARRIVTALAQVLLHYLEGGKSLNTAVQFPRFHSEGATLHIEGDLASASELEELGHQVQVHGPLDLFFGGVTGLAWEEGKPMGVFDRRRDGDVFLE